MVSKRRRHTQQPKNLVKIQAPILALGGMIFTGIIIKPISPRDWSWSRLIPFMGFPGIKTHHWGCFLGLGTPQMDSPGRGACFRTQKLGLGTPQMGSPGRGACFRTQKLGLGTPQMDSPGRGACFWTQKLGLGTPTTHDSRLSRLHDSRLPCVHDHDRSRPLHDSQPRLISYQVWEPFPHQANPFS